MKVNWLYIIPFFFILSCSYENVIISINFRNDYFEPIYKVNIGEKHYDSIDTGKEIGSLHFSNGNYKISCTSKSNLNLNTTLSLDEQSDASILLTLNKNGKFILEKLSKE